MKEIIEIMNYNIIERIKNEYKYLDFYYFAILFGCIFIISVYGIYLIADPKEHKDFLEFEIFKNSRKYELDGWSITHLLFFMLLGYLYHNVFFITFLLGIIWELMEFFIGRYNWEFLGFPKPLKNKKWWYGKYSDPIVNFFGLILGIYLYRWIN